jgi:hypothetical protein
MLIQVRGVLVHAMSSTELSRVRTEFRLLPPEPINRSPLESRGPTLLCNQVLLARFHLSGFGLNQDLTAIVTFMIGFGLPKPTGHEREHEESRDTNAFAGADVPSDALGPAAHRPSWLIHSQRSSKIVPADAVSDCLSLQEGKQR